jgi:hypothetical protein
VAVFFYNAIKDIERGFEPDPLISFPGFSELVRIGPERHVNIVGCGRNRVPIHRRPPSLGKLIDS